MQNQLLFFLFVATLLLVSCNPAAEKDKNPDLIQDDTLQVMQEETQKKEPENGNFEEAFQDFLLAIRNQDTVAFNQFIDAERGLWIIENPGAVPKMTPVKDIGRFRLDLKEASFFSIGKKFEKCHLKEVKALPTFNCEGKPGNEAGYEKTGCFVTDATAFHKAGIYRYADLTQKQLNEVEATLPFVTKTVLHTKSTHKFHFGYLNGHWKVLFIDLMIPCSA